MPPTQRSPRLARSDRPTIQDHPTTAPNADKTITKSAKTIHLDHTISSKNTGRPPNAAPSRNFPRKSVHPPPRTSRAQPNRAEQARTHRPEET